jgi:hypothetical protein
MQPQDAAPEPPTKNRGGRKGRLYPSTRNPAAKSLTLARDLLSAATGAGSVRREGAATRPGDEHPLRDGDARTRLRDGAWQAARRPCRAAMRRSPLHASLAGTGKGTRRRSPIPGSAAARCTAPWHRTRATPPKVRGGRCRVALFLQLAIRRRNRSALREIFRRGRRGAVARGAGDLRKHRLAQPVRRRHGDRHERAAARLAAGKLLIR